MQGPYLSDSGHNDAVMLQKEVLDDGNTLRQWLGEIPILIIHRANRDFIPLLDVLEINHCISALLV